jgi:hypothetical protein
MNWNGSSSKVVVDDRAVANVTLKETVLVPKVSLRASLAQPTNNGVRIIMMATIGEIVDTTRDVDY